MLPSSLASVEASGSIFCGEAASQIVYDLPSPVGSRPSAATCSAKLFFTRPKIATPVASPPSTAEREALVTSLFPPSEAFSSAATDPSPEEEEVVEVVSLPPPPPPPKRTKTTNKITIAAPARRAQSPRPSSSFNSLFKGGFGPPLGSAGRGGFGSALGGGEARTTSGEGFSGFGATGGGGDSP